MMSKDKEDGSKTCIESNYDECMYGALVDHMHSNTQSEGGCTVPWVLDDNLEGTSKICKEPDNINKTFWIAWNRVTNQKKDCPVPCDSLLVSLGAKNYKVRGHINNHKGQEVVLSTKTFFFLISALTSKIGQMCLRSNEKKAHYHAS